MANLYVYDQAIIIDLIVILLLIISASLFKYLTVFQYILLRVAVGMVLGKLRMGRYLKTHIHKRIQEIYTCNGSRYHRSYLDMGGDYIKIVEGLQ